MLLFLANNVVCSEGGCSGFFRNFSTFLPFYMDTTSVNKSLKFFRFSETCRYIEMLKKRNTFKRRCPLNYHGHYQHRSDISSFPDRYTKQIIKLTPPGLLLLLLQIHRMEDTTVSWNLLSSAEHINNMAGHQYSNFYYV